MGLWLVCRARLLGSGLQNLARRQFFVAGRLRLPANQRRKDERASGLGQARPPRRWLALYDDPPPASGQVDGLVKREVFRTVDVIGNFAQQCPSKWNALGAAVEIPHNVDAKPRSHDHWAVFHLVELPFQFGKRPNEHRAQSEHAVTLHPRWDDKSGYELYAAPTIHVLDATADTGNRGSPFG